MTALKSYNISKYYVRQFFLMDYKEIQVPVPWGHVAGKAYGNEKDECIIALHGYQDNANSFNRLIPLLPKCFYYIAIDFPGHGKSSPFDTTLLVTYMDFILALKLVLDKLNRKKYIFLAHSFGCQTTVFLAHLYPEYVSKLVCIDGIIYIPQHTAIFMPRLRKYLNKYSDLRKFTLDTAPLYTKEEAIERMKNGRAIHMSDETANMLADRSLVPAGNGKYKITTAQFLKYSIRFPLTLKQINHVVKTYPLNCPFLFIRASESDYFFQLVQEPIEEFKQNKHFLEKVVEGTHDVHMEEPEKLAPIITEFLLKNIHKL